MGMSEVEQLAKMANQIADNFSFHDNAEERIADHLTRFWAPSMRKLLVEYEQQDGSGLKSSVIAAIRKLA